MIDLEHLKATVNRSIFNRHDPQWIEAFREFNANRDKRIMMFPLGMNCKSCYHTVLKYHTDK